MPKRTSNPTTRTTKYITMQGLKRPKKPILQRIPKQPKKLRGRTVSTYGPFKEVRGPDILTSLSGLQLKLLPSLLLHIISNKL